MVTIRVKGVYFEMLITSFPGVCLLLPRLTDLCIKYIT